MISYLNDELVASQLINKLSLAKDSSSYNAGGDMPVEGVGDMPIGMDGMY